MASYPHLTAPGTIGPLALRNRVLLCPMGDNLANPDGTISDRQLGYYAARAEGGAALLLIGSTGIGYPDGCTAPEQTAISDDGQLPGLSRLAATVHERGAAIAAQLVHNGPNAVLDIARGRPMLVPSIPPRLRMDRLSGMITPEELEAMTGPFTRPGAGMSYQVATEDDLAAVIDQYASAAARAQEAGFDGVEVHAGHGYLIDTFLSPYSNGRDDRWGGDLEGRARLLVEVLRAVRDRVGTGMAVWLRLNAREVGKEGGETLDDAVAVARMAAAAGADAVHVTAYADPGEGIGITAAHTPHTPGLRVPDAAAIKAAVGIPVITYGRLSADDAEQALVDGAADFVAMGRKLLAGPDLPRAIATGDPDAARPCAYQYRCIGNIFLHRPLACAVSPDTTREVELRPKPGTGRQRVLVVGGGPVGLEAAHRLAAGGHEVALWEATDRLGGTLVVGGWADPNLAPLVDWLERRVRDTGVEVTLGRRATAELVAGFGPDRVVLALGAPFAGLDVPGGDLPHVVTVDGLRARPDALDAALGSGALAVVGSGKAAVSLAAAARRLGRQVTLVADDTVLAPELGTPGRFRWVHDLEESGVAIHLGARVAAVESGALTLAAPADGDPTTVAADVVLVAGPRSAPVLPASVVPAGMETTVLGDATGTTGLESGLLAAARLAAQVGTAPT